MTLNRYFELMDNQLGLCFDFGNWHQADKYDQLAQIVHHAESCHAKCVFDASGHPDRDDFLKFIDITAKGRFSGPYTLVASRPSDIWGGIEYQRDLILEMNGTQ